MRGAAGVDDNAVQIGALARHHAVAMYQVAVAIVRDRGLAEDVVQESLLKMWLNIEGYRGDAPIRAWAVRITHNTAVSMLRRVKDTPLDPMTLGGRESDRVEDLVLARADLVAIAGRLGDLDELSRTVLALREGQGMSYADIAEALGITLGQVKIRLYRARQHLLQATRSEGAARST